MISVNHQNAYIKLFLNGQLTLKKMIEIELQKELAFLELYRPKLPKKLENTVKSTTKDSIKITV